jgi:hypothetical protein
MEREKECKDFRCPEFVPAFAPDDFCIPEECCPERIPQPKFPSPTSCLPEEQLEEVEALISEANRFLLDIGLSGEREKDEVLERAFEGLHGQFVVVHLECESSSTPENEMNAEGFIFLVGQDFVLLKAEKKDLIVPFEQVTCIEPRNRFAQPEEEPRLRDIEPCFRRRLTFNFGEVVGSSPELIQIFFGLTLKIYLLLLIGKEVRFVTDEDNIKGILYDIFDESFTLKAEDRMIEIPISEICKVIV